MLIRPTTVADLDRAAAFVVDDPVSRITEDRYRAELAERQFRPEWTWVAEQDGEILARAVWWGRSDSDHPVALDCLHVSRSAGDRAGTAAALLAAGLRAFREAGATRDPQYNLSLPAGWRTDPAVAAAVAWRRAAAASAGLGEEIERLRYEWTPAAGVPARTGRLVFSPEPDDEAFVAVFRRIAGGSLDIVTRRDVAALGADRQARDDLDFYRNCPGRREWWRLAHTPDGTLVGMALPSRTPYHPNVGYLGVVPEFRGRGYIDEVLAEITRFHAAEGAQRITATTDTVNVPMAAAFDRAGYQVTEIRLVFEAPAG
ncbi:GNAT family N-acetyltransferase [Streptomyces griseocarneus]|uniref:GNAT family N-acetyltransferase n=1 Tax=Streptomyces griseocarneus TaxID=51201 RepID=UPI00167CD180|nr:GNAT family N-acetyltransferase [Streptomyces griseocarneus]MBZ6477178.1 GNAT family N-acetyltransferase [Streptomyces griseocarneus]GHG53932.1 N-acetyltransferase [Streptomyces griseocarneus]